MTVAAFTELQEEVRALAREKRAMLARHEYTRVSWDFGCGRRTSGPWFQAITNGTYCSGRFGRHVTQA